MDAGVRITVRVRKYLWSEFVHDVCYVLYATIMISNALCKRYLKRSIPQVYHLLVDPVARFFGKLESYLKTMLLIIIVIFIGIFALIYTVGVPIVFILGAMGKIN